MLVQIQTNYIQLHSQRNIHHGKWIFSDEKSVKYQSSMKNRLKNDSMGTLILNGNNSQIFEILCCALLL